MPTVTSISPPTGPVAGDTPIIITGTNFIGATNSETSLYNVSINGTVLTNMTVVSATSIRGSTPAGIAGLVNINVTTPNGTSVTGTNKYTYVDLPKFISITPLTGSTTGGTPITIVGENLAGATKLAGSMWNVSIGGINLTNMTVVSSTKIIGSTLAHESGPVDVIISTPNGTSVTGTSAYTYGLPPVVTSVAPPTAPVSGITNVTITGSSLTGATAVTFGGTPATNITVINDTTINASAPAHAAGLVNVNVTTPNGVSVTGTGVYLYVALPTVTSVAPPTGPLVGGTGVTIIGTNLTGATAVTFGRTLATDVSVVNVTAITATAPANAAGLVYVNVSTPNGTAIGVSKYTYVALPTVTSISPPTGPVAGDTPIIITGTNFIGATNSGSSLYNVSINGTVLTNMTVVSATSIRGSTPAGIAGLVNINVTTPNGTSVTGTNKYTYVDVPTFTSITPVTGSTAGGTPVTITGTNLIGATNSGSSIFNVSIGGTALTNMTVVSSTKIIGSTRAGNAGLADVIISTPNGTATGGAGAYTYAGPPTFTNITPASGTTLGGTTVTISGTNLIGANAGGVNGNVTIGGSLVTIVSVVSDSITATTPAHAAGAVNVVITTPNGTATGTGVYSYGAPPTFTSITPASGTTAGGTTVTISGTNLIGANAGGVKGNVTMGGSPATIVSVVSGSITATTPAHAAGAVDIVITTPNGTANGTGVYSYRAPPTFTSINPASGTTAGGTTVTISGTNLIGANAGGVNGNVTIGGSPATIVSVVSGSITATTPAHAAGEVDVVITTPNGTATGGTGAYTYTVPPTVTHIAPPTGQNTTTISIANLQGTGFYGTPTVNLTKTGENNITATDVTVASATKITCKFDLSGKKVGAWNVTVINPDGQSGSLFEGFTVTNSTPSPAVSSITPSTGQNNASVIITDLAGTGFLSGATVKLTKSGQTDIVATGVTVVSATRITCTFDLTGKAAGPWNIVVTNTDTQTGTLTNGFTVTSLTPTPTFTSITPASGTTAGGTTVTISGTNLIGANAGGVNGNVTIGGALATIISVVSGSITATTPAHAAGAVNVVITTPNGTATGGTGAYTYVSGLTVTDIAPPTGKNTKTIRIANLKGTGFYGSPTVNLTKTGENNITATDVTVESATKISCTFDLSGKTTGAWNIIVINPDGQQASLINGFTITDSSHSPAVTSITPSTGQNTTSVIITNLAGTRFLSGATVNLTKSGEPDIVATGVTVVSATKITCTFDLTGKAAGPWNIVVTNTDNQTGTLPNGFTVTKPIPVASFTQSPVTGPAPLTVSFTDTSTNNPTSWNWNFGEGNTSTIQNPINSYVNPGVYNVTLTATNIYGSSPPNTSVKIISVTTPVTQSNTTYPGVTVSNATEKNFQFNITSVVNSGGSVSNASSTQVDYQTPGWKNIVLTGTNITTSNGNIFVDKVTSVKMATLPLTYTFDSVGTARSQFVLDQKTMTQGAAFERAVVPGANETVTSRFQLAVQGQGATLGAIGYTVEVTGSAPFNANMTGTNPVSINLSVSHAWVMANGGTGAIRILHLPESGTAESLTTTYAFGDGTTDYFKAHSNGLSIFGLASVTTNPTPAQASGPASSSGTIQSGQPSIISATANPAQAGQTVSYSFGTPSATYPVSIQSVSFVPNTAIPQSLCVVQQQGPSAAFGLKDRPAAYENIEISWINPNAITSGTIHFSLLGSWAKENQIEPANVVLLRSHDLVWTELPTSFEHTEGDIHYYSSNTPGFSYFAVSQKLPPLTEKATPQATVSPAGSVQPASPSVTVTALITPVQTKMGPEVGKGTSVLSPAPEPSVIPDTASILLVFGVALFCATIVIYLYFRKMSKKTSHKTPHKTRVLIVDDEPQIVELFSFILDMEGYEPIKASSGKECLLRLSDKKNSPDVILLDVTMSPMDGWETLEAIKKDPALRKIPVLMLTGKQLLPEEAKHYGICIEDYLLKPIMPHAMYDAIEYVINRKKKIDAEIQLAIKAGHEKALVCEYAKLAKQVDVDKKLLKLMGKKNSKMEKTGNGINQTIEDLADDMVLREEKLIQLRERISVSPLSFICLEFQN
ncbi:MAG: IPT/TIG domain-containing protein [Methanoregula sp.]|nr:IPT/TIG domain-containing protein [Methanoregula sp.]